MSIADALPNLIGSRISLISHRDVRYEGTLQSVNVDDTSIVVQDVQCLGTEGRGEGPAVAASDSVYDVCVFKSVDIKDLHIHPEKASPISSPVAPDTPTSCNVTNELLGHEPTPAAAAAAAGAVSTTPPLLNGIGNLTANLTPTTSSPVPSPPLSAATSAAVGSVVYSNATVPVPILEPPLPAAAALGSYAPSQPQQQIPVSTFLPIPAAHAAGMSTAASSMLHHRSLQPSSAPFVPGAAYQSVPVRELRQIQNTHRQFNGHPYTSNAIGHHIATMTGSDYAIAPNFSQGRGGGSPIMMAAAAAHHSLPGPFGSAMPSTTLSSQHHSNSPLTRHREQHFQPPAAFTMPVPAGSCVDTAMGIPLRNLTPEDRQVVSPYMAAAAAASPLSDRLSQPMTLPAGVVLLGANGPVSAAANTDSLSQSRADLAGLSEGFSGLTLHDGISGFKKQLQQLYDPNGSSGGSSYASLIKSFATVGDENGAESVVRQLENKNIKTDVQMYNALMSAYAANGNWQGAEDVLRRMLSNQNVEPNVITYSSLMSAYANKGNSDGAEGVLHRMASSNVQPNLVVFNHLIDAYANKGNWEGAEDVLRRMNKLKEMEPNAITFSSLINAYANKGDWRGAENVLRRMQYQGVQPNVLSYNGLVNAYAKEGNWQGAEDVLRRMQETGVEPNVATFNAAINAYANKGHWRGAEDILRRMLEPDMEPSLPLLEGPRRVMPNVITFNLVIKAHAKDGNWEGAEDVMRRLLERSIEPNVTTFNSILKSYTKEGNSEGAEDVLRRMVDFNLKPNTITFTSLINAYATKGDWRGAEDVLRRMQEAGVEPNVTTLSSVINAYANKGHWMGAEDILRRMELRGLEPDVITFNSLLKVYSNARDVDGCGRGLTLVQTMVAKRLKPTHVTFKTLFGLLLKHPDRVKLNTALLLMHDHLPVRSRNSPIYAPLIELCGATGSIDAAMHYLDEARRGGHLDKYVIRAGRQVGLLVGHGNGGGGGGMMEDHQMRKAMGMGRHVGMK